MNDAIASTLQKNQIDQTIESDEEVEEENEILRRVMSRYQEKAETEKALKQISKKQTISVKPINDLITRPIIFDGNWKQPLQDCNLGVNCDICIPDKLLSHPRKGKNHGSFREVEFDPMEFSTSDEHACSNGRGNRSRQIAAQRAASVLLLSEIRHRLNFISTYNQAFNNDCEMSKHEISGSQGMEKSPTGEPSKKKTNREASGKPSVRKSQTYKEMQRQLPVHNNSSLARLPYEKISEDFQVMMQKNFVPLTSHPQILTISALQESILAAIEEQPECEWEEGDLEEHKTYLRAIRTYSGKADQERIEKRQHDEERELQLRELHYKNRGRKASAEEMELLNMESRPIIFGSSCEKNSCKLGNSCTICRGGCAQMLEPDTGVILHPAYKRVEGMFLDSDFKTDARRSRTRERFQQRELAVESLKRLHHRISFIQQYNNGWMITEKRRK